MDVSSMMINFSLKPNETHATQASFANGQWTFDGPIHPLVGEMTSQVASVVRGSMDAIKKHQQQSQD